MGDAAGLHHSQVARVVVRWKIRIDITMNMMLEIIFLEVFFSLFHPGNVILFARQ